ncbi:hypothetical protein K2E96_02110 [Pseudomonas sp. ERGC3:05]|nr:hypothetical protein [Pseudomonas sp. ERGC3:01]QZC95122.1 hypothetical protein K2E96_02110 [Pseudomonas sp. ERGC3:05]
MSTTETHAPQTELDRITLVLRPQKGSTLNQVHQFVGTGLIVAIGRGMGVLEHYCPGDAVHCLGEAIELHAAQIELYEAALGTPAHLSAHAQEMFDLLHRINVKVGGLNAVVGHGGEPSEQMWEEHDEAMDAIWDLLAKVKSSASVDKASVNQIAQNLENVNQQQNALQNIPEGIPEACDSMHIDDRVRMAANSKRYEWLRDRTCIEDADNDIMVVRGDKYFDGDELDREIDNALSLARLEEQHS